MRASCRCNASLPLNTSVCVTLFILGNCTNTVLFYSKKEKKLDPLFNPELHLTFSCYVPLLFNQEPFLFFVFYDVDILKNISSNFIENGPFLTR